MITSKQIKYILEKYYDTRNIRGHEVIIYENPTPGDIKEIATAAMKQNRELVELRFIAVVSPSPKIYVWDSYLSIHTDISSLYGLDLRSPSVLHGEVSINNGRIDVKDQDVYNSVGGLNRKIVNSFLGYNWSFLDKYFGPKFGRYIDTLKKAYL